MRRYSHFQSFVRAFNLLYNLLLNAHTFCMSKRKKKKRIRELMDGCASANECTGLLQKVDLDPEEVATFHKMYNNLEGHDSTS